MLLFENISLAFSALVANKMRSLLTMLGIIIGISSVISIVTVGNSLSASLDSEMGTIGAHNIEVGVVRKEVETEHSENGAGFRGMESSAPITDQDLINDEMLRELVEEYPDKIEAISIEYNAGEGTIVAGRNSASIVLSGVSRGYFSANNIEIVAGTDIPIRAYKEAKAVALVSEKLVEKLYGGDNDKIIGTTIETNIGNTFYDFVVCGVYKADEMYNIMGGNRPTEVYVPIKSAQYKKHKYTGYGSVTLVLNSEVVPDDFQGDVRRFLGRYYRKNKNFDIDSFSMSSAFEAASKMLNTVSIAISVIAGISLLVGGIGVMNIMLVSISERTKEIGTRKALGASNSSIRIQFIVEAMVICLMGGVFGLILGLLGGSLGAKLLECEASPSLTSIVGSILFSLAIGVFFGYYPANKAAKMNPIDALRYE